MELHCFLTILISLSLLNVVFSQGQIDAYFESKRECGTTNDRVLTGEAYRNISSASGLACTSECIADERCRSVNYSKTNTTCELHSTIANSCSQLYTKPGYQHYEKKVTGYFFLLHSSFEVHIHD